MRWNATCARCRASPTCRSRNRCRAELLIRPRADEAARAGVTAASIGTVARIATVGDTNANSARFNFADRQVPVRVLLPALEQGDLQALGNLRVSTDSGATVALRSVADIGYGSGPARIERSARLRRISVDADLSERRWAPRWKPSTPCPPCASCRPACAGSSTATRSTCGKCSRVQRRHDLRRADGVCGADPAVPGFPAALTILTSLPLAIGGAVGGLLLYGAAIDLPVVIGLLMLMGIVTKNSILMVEFVIEKRRHGLARHEALMQSGAERARPIIMTTIAMVAGMVPALLITGADAGFRAPMAVAVIGGLITSTLLSLIFVPVVFSYMDDLRNWLAPRLARLTSVTQRDRDEEEA